MKYGLAIGDFFLPILERNSQWRWRHLRKVQRDERRREGGRRRRRRMDPEAAGRSGVDTTDE